jgi:hypothetical protein
VYLNVWQFNEYNVTESDVWTAEEIDRYTRAILTYDKDFFRVSIDVSDIAKEYLFVMIHRSTELQ